MRAQEELTAYLFHELRNDLNALVGCLDVLTSGVESGEARVSHEVGSVLLERAACDLTWPRPLRTT